MSDLPGPILTAEMLTAAMDALWNTPWQVCHHCVAPRYGGWHLTQKDEEIDAYTNCALCGVVICITRPKAEAEI